MKTKEEIVESHFGSDFHEVSQPCCLVHICNAMEEYAKAYHEDKTSWISVSERLPEIEILERNDINNSLPVIAILKNGEVYKMVLSHWYEDDPNVFNWVYSDSGEIESNVTHWQPLPKLTQNKVLLTNKIAI